MSAFNCDFNSKEGSRCGDKPKIVRSDFFDWWLLDEKTRKCIIACSGHKTIKADAIEYFILKGYRNVTAG